VPGYGIEMVKTIALFPLCGVSNSRLETEKNYALCPMPYAPLTTRLIQQALYSKLQVYEVRFRNPVSLRNRVSGVPHIPENCYS
jgi:hypothetical protein